MVSSGTEPLGRGAMRRHRRAAWSDHWKSPATGTTWWRATTPRPCRLVVGKLAHVVHDEAGEEVGHAIVQESVGGVVTVHLNCAHNSLRSPGPARHCGREFLLPSRARGWHRCAPPLSRRAATAKPRRRQRESGLVYLKMAMGWMARLQRMTKALD